MRIWVDVCHPKEGWLLKALLPHLRGHRMLVTARRGLWTTEVLDMLDVPYTPVGRYGYSLREKLVLATERSIGLLAVLEGRGMPDILIGHGSVEATRLAFGLGIPIVHANDTIINVPVIRLTVPLLDRLVTPGCLKREWWARFGIPPSRVVQYDGVEEAAYVRRYPERDVSKALDDAIGTVPDRLVVARGLEARASYVRAWKERLDRVVREVARKASVVYLPRYKGEEARFEGVENVFVPDRPVNCPLLVGASDLVICGGGTIAREAALLGTPTISLHIYDVIGRYLSSRGFPLYHAPDPSEACRLAIRIIDRPGLYRRNTRGALARMESPVRYIQSAIRQLKADPGLRG